MEQALDIFGAVIGSCWNMLSFTVPGLGVSCQTFVVALLLINVSIAVLAFLGIGGSGTTPRSGSGGKKYISENRKGDEK